MFPNKIKLTPDYINLITKKRKEHNLTAYQLSEKIGKNKSWLPNIENKRTKNISKEDFFSLFKDFAAEEGITSEQYIVKYLPRNCIIELEDGVTAPCFHVKHMLGLEDKDAIYNQPSQQFVDELTFRVSERSDRLKGKDVQASLINLTNTINTHLNRYNINTKDEYAQLIDSMTINLRNNFEYTLQLYGNTFCPNDPFAYDSNCRSEYIKDLNILQKYIETYLRTIEWKSFLYSFIEGTPFNTYRFFDNIKNWNDIEKGEDEKLSFAFDDVKSYQFGLFSYIEYHKEFSDIFKNAPKIEYHFLFSKFYEILELFLSVANINYHLVFSVPNNDVTPEELELLHRQTDKILFDIEKELCSKFKNRSKWF